MRNTRFEEEYGQLKHVTVINIFLSRKTSQLFCVSSSSFCYAPRGLLVDLLTPNIISVNASLFQLCHE
jgi:hypothetical protein